MDNADNERDVQSAEVPDGFQDWGDDAKKHITKLNRENAKWRNEVNSHKSKLSEFESKIAAIEEKERARGFSSIFSSWRPVSNHRRSTDTIARLSPTWVPAQPSCAGPPTSPWAYATSLPC